MVLNNQNQPEVTVNGDFDNFDYAINGPATFALVDSPTALTLSIAQMVSAFVFSLTGTLSAARNVIVPANPRFFAVMNNTSGAGSPLIAGYAVTVKTASGTGVSVTGTAGLALLYCDGTNVVQAGSSAGSSAIVRRN